jgi:pyridoxal phosphate enzyme (YggS family)
MSRAEALAAALAALEMRLSAACAAAGREREQIVLIAVSKTRPVGDIEILRSLGVEDFGENRDQEARQKAAEVSGVRWHFVGSLQTNKAGSVTAYADVVHSVDRLPLVAALSGGAGRSGRDLDVLLQVSLDGDPARGGARTGEVPGLAAAVAAAPGLRLRGVMAIAPRGGPVVAAAAFAVLHEVALRLREEHPDARAVSAGMTSDLEQAITAGATHLRIGTALFGRRSPRLR